MQFIEKERIVLYNQREVRKLFSKVLSIGLFGMESYVVEVEADIGGGLPRFDMVGLPDAAVSESKERVRSAMKNSGYDFPSSKIVINLSPADVKKGGSVFDLPVLIALLEATRQLTADIKNKAFIGELSLNGDVRRVNGVLPMVIKARQAGINEIFISVDNNNAANMLRNSRGNILRALKRLDYEPQKPPKARL